MLMLPIAVLAQSGPKQYWIQFTDKTNTPFDLNSPLDFLSQRALDRRQAQDIELNESDLPVDPAYIQAVLDEGTSYLTHSKWFNSVSVHIPDSTILNAVMQLPFVVQTLAVGKTEKTIGFSDKFDIEVAAKSIAGVTPETDYGLAFNQIDMLGGLSLHEAGYMGQGMLIAVLDAGFPNVNTLSVFDSLNAHGRIAGTWDFVSQNDTVFDDNSHGMSVLSTMAAYEPGVMIGTAPLASYLLLRTEDGVTEFPIEEDYWVAGAEFADSAGADIINSSLGYTTFQNSMFDHTYDDMDGNTTHGAIGADLAASKGILVVNSAGNSGTSAWLYIGTPTDGDSVLAIGAVDSLGVIASFSSNGPSSDGDIKPNVCAQGALAAIVNSAGQVIMGNGTSFSSPILAGMAACLWQAYPDSGNMDIFHTIEASAHLFNTPDHLYGYGIPNFAYADLILSGFTPLSIKNDQLFPVFPNPFSDRVEGTFYSSTEQDLQIRLVNGLGQVIQKMNGKAGKTCAVPFQFTGLQNLAEGAYFLQIISDDEKFERTVMKLGD